MQHSRDGSFSGANVDPHRGRLSQQHETTMSQHARCCPGPPDGDTEGQARARPGPDGPDAAAIPATRTKAVTPTATAPMTEKAIWQPSDGMR